MGLIAGDVDELIEFWTLLAEDDWAELLTPEDRRGLTPLFRQRVLPCGEVKLGMTARLSIRTTAPSTPRASPDTAP
jgi:hypothetical protein